MAAIIEGSIVGLHMPVNTGATEYDMGEDGQKADSRLVVSFKNLICLCNSSTLNFTFHMFVSIYYF